LGNLLTGVKIVFNRIKPSRIVSSVVATLILWASCGNALAFEEIVLAVPGPGSLVYLPVQLAQAIGADRAEGIELKLRYFPGGPLAMRDLRDRNSDFAVVGLPAIASARADGMPVLAVGQLSQTAMVSLMLRHDLKDKIKSIAQLKGLRIGTNNSTRTARSTSQMLTEYLLVRAGVKTSEVQIIPTGQNREAQRAALDSKSVDALMGDEPFASELLIFSKNMTTVEPLMRCIYRLVPGEYGHGAKAIERSSKEEIACWANAAKRQRLCRSGFGRRRSTPDGVHMEGTVR
jgi:ABC-type nitrate/sulfonate/bicarbonate transport system substrate-binding protein